MTVVHHTGRPDGPARWAVGLAAAVVAALAATILLFALAYVAGGADAIEDNWVGMLGAVAVLGGLAASLAAFALALVARARHAQRAMLWLPLSVFPALLAFLVVGETFWWE